MVASGVPNTSDFLQHITDLSSAISRLALFAERGHYLKDLKLPDTKKTVGSSADPEGRLLGMSAGLVTCPVTVT